MDIYNNLYEIYSKYDNFSNINNALSLLCSKNKLKYRELVIFIRLPNRKLKQKLSKIQKMNNFINYLLTFNKNYKNINSDIDCIIYNRISSKNQIEGHSLNIQDSIIKDYIINENNKNQNIITFNDIHTGYSKLSPILKFILLYGNNYKLYVSKYDRLTRNTEYLESVILPSFINNKIELIVVNNSPETSKHFIEFNSYDKKVLRNEIVSAQNESDIISDRIKKMQQFKKINKSKLSKLKSLSKHDLMILRLISTMKHGNVSLEYINRLIKKICHSYYPNNYEPLEISTGFDFIMKGGLSKRNIANILNEYSFKTRYNKPWTICTVDSLLKYNTTTFNNIIDRINTLEIN